MGANDPATIPTRQSLLERLKDLGNQEDWRRFFDTYWRLIHAAAVKAGLTETEAEEVVQEVMIAAAKKLPEFVYQPGKDSLKGWLLAVTRWKVNDQYRKRRHGRAGAEPVSLAGGGHGRAGADETGRTATIERVPDPAPPELDVHWEEEWHTNLLRAALDRVKGRVDPAHYEIYHLAAVRGLSSRDTAKALGVSVAHVYLVKHRVGRLLRAEVERLRA